MIRWRKLGRVYVARGERAWQQTHAYAPTSVLLDDERIRVFCAFLDADTVGRAGWVDLDARDPTRVLEVSERPALDVGAAGTFDDNGITPLSVCTLDERRLRLYYAGWQLGVKQRYYLFTGAADSDDAGASFRRVSQVPILDRSEGELFVRTGGHVRRGGAGWRMWYAGGSGWVQPAGGAPARPAYDMRYLESADGVTWARQGRICMRPEGEDEHGFGRPAVLEEPDGKLRMWYSVRRLSNGYRIGYGESYDGLTWERRDEQAGIDVSERGWDSTHVSMAWLQQTRHGTYLFYNGNNYGETGFGVAVAEGE
jgi:hypothetical protein